MAEYELKTDKLKTKILNASSQRQSSERFNVRFLGIVDNISDFLSRQVISVTPRSLSFETVTHGNRKSQIRDIGKIETETLNVTLGPDDEGIVETILMMQVMRQKGVSVPDFSNTGDGRFNVKIEYYNVSGEVTHYSMYKNCFIQTLEKPEMRTGEPNPTEMTLTLSYERVSYSFLDEEFFIN